MFGFFKRASARPLPAAIVQAIDRDGAPSTIPLSDLRMVESKGRYSDRKVSYFRVFDPAAAAQRMIEVRRYADLDAVQNLILHSGHIESDGKVVVTRTPVIRAASPSVRTAADRSQHADDAHIVMYGETGATANPRPAEAQPSGEAR